MTNPNPFELKSELPVDIKMWIDVLKERSGGQFLCEEGQHGQMMRSLYPQSLIKAMNEFAKRNDGTYEKMNRSFWEIVKNPEKYGFIKIDITHTNPEWTRKRFLYTSVEQLIPLKY